jgi:hypothetical protein
VRNRLYCISWIMTPCAYLLQRYQDSINDP